MTKEQVIELMKKGAVLYYWYLQGSIAVVTDEFPKKGSVNWISVPVFHELKEDNTIDVTKSGNYTDIIADKYQLYELVKKDKK